jgi:hypothetical protein
MFAGLQLQLSDSAGTPMTPSGQIFDHASCDQ